MNKQELIEALKHIDYTLQGTHPNEDIENNVGSSTYIRVLNERLELKVREGISIVCHFEKIKLEKVETSLCIQSINDDDTTGFFIMLRKVI